MVIAIIGILVSLLLPAVQSAREAARRTQCQNNLRQISLAWMLHLDGHGHYPSGGWRCCWGGIADMGIGLQQPGGWAYTALPFLEEQALFDLGRGLTGEPYRKAGEVRLKTPVTTFYCPTRRAAQAYPWGGATNGLKPSEHYQTADGSFIPQVAKLDYAANLGNAPRSCCPGGEEFDLELAKAPGKKWEQLPYDGLSYAHSQVTGQMVSDGTSKTYMVAEKYLNIDLYANGLDPGDNEAAYASHNSDNYRTVSTIFGPPRRDRSGLSIKEIFGSSHQEGFHAAFCDGSVRSVSFSIQPAVHVANGTRNGDEVIAQ